mgnify:CR=1 FL=1
MVHWVIYTQANSQLNGLHDLHYDDKEEPIRLFVLLAIGISGPAYEGAPTFTFILRSWEYRTSNYFICTRGGLLRRFPPSRPHRSETEYFLRTFRRRGRWNWLQEDNRPLIYSAYRIESAQLGWPRNPKNGDLGGAKIIKKSGSQWPKSPFLFTLESILKYPGVGTICYKPPCFSPDGEPNP